MVLVDREVIRHRRHSRHSDSKCLEGQEGGWDHLSWLGSKRAWWASETITSGIACKAITLVGVLLELATLKIKHLLNCKILAIGIM